MIKRLLHKFEAAFFLREGWKRYGSDLKEGHNSGQPDPF